MYDDSSSFVTASRFLLCVIGVFVNCFIYYLSHFDKDRYNILKAHDIEFGNVKNL